MENTNSSSARRIATLQRHIVTSSFDAMASRVSTSSPSVSDAAKKTERKNFVKVFDQLAEELVAELDQFEQPRYAKDWVKRLLKITVPGGKMNRGLTVLHTLKIIRHPKPLTAEEEFRACVLGWTVEMVQAFFLIADDLMDQSETRRGLPCWYRQSHPLAQSKAGATINLVAANDSIIVESAIFRVLKKHFSHLPYYLPLLELIHETIYQTELGQLLDLTSQPPDAVDVSMITLDRYEKIVKYKTAYYSFYCPVVMGLYLGGCATPEALRTSEDILIPMGEYFQVQDDFLDCYGDPKVIGKIGRDIEEKKCGWLACQALLKCTPAQRKIMEKHYGIDNPADVKIIKQLYSDLNLTAIFRAYENESYERLRALIENNKSAVPNEVFYALLHKIYKRKL